MYVIIETITNEDKKMKEERAYIAFTRHGKNKKVSKLMVSHTRLAGNYVCSTKTYVVSKKEGLVNEMFGA